MIVGIEDRATEGCQEEALYGAYCIKDKDAKAFPCAQISRGDVASVAIFAIDTVQICAFLFMNVEYKYTFKTLLKNINLFVVAYGARTHLLRTYFRVRSCARTLEAYRKLAPCPSKFASQSLGDIDFISFVKSVTNSCVYRRAE